MGILDGMLGSVIGQFAGAGAQPVQQARALQPFRSFVTITDGDADYNTEAEVYGAIGAAGVWAIIWERTIPAQQEWRWGSGNPALPQNQGYMWFAIVDEGTDFEVGTLRLVQMNANRTRRIVVAEMLDTQLHSTDSTTTETAALINKNEMQALPEKVEYPRVGEDSIIALEYNEITAATLADAAAFQIPVTKYM